MEAINEFIAGIWVTVTVVIVGNMIRQGIQINNLKVKLEKEITRSVEVDRNHDSEIHKITETLNKIDNKMDQVILAYTDTKTMLNAEIIRNRKSEG